MSRSPTRQRGQQTSLLDVGASVTLAAYVGMLMVLLGAAISYLGPLEPAEFFGSFAEVFASEDLKSAIRLSLVTATLTAVLSLVVAVPVAYALSRQRLPGRLLLDTIVDIPIVLPPLVMGVALLVFFNTPLGRGLEATGLRFAFRPAGVVLAQFLVVSPYAVRTVKAALDDIDPRLENVARTLGYSKIQVFLRVTLPMLRGGIVAGGVLTWSQAIGLFGPIMVFAGTMRRHSEVMATSIYLQLSVGRLHTALAISILMVIMAMAALLVFKWSMGRGRSPW